MNEFDNEIVQRFNEEVAIKFQLYNSLFLSLPFHKIEKTGLYLSLFNQLAEECYGQKGSAIDVIHKFFSEVHKVDTIDDIINLLFNFIQYTERQVVLFDAMEDSAFAKINDLDGPGTLNQMFLEKPGDFNELKDFSINLILTAHPTQFYPGSVLGIIHDLANELKTNNTTAVNALLRQLGRTPFIKKEKPTPYDEATSLIWYLENVFYEAIGNLISTRKKNVPNLISKSLINMGFWPGGDRDGNPFVDAHTTLKVAKALKTAIIKCYFRDVRKLKRRLTFSGLENELSRLESNLNDYAYSDKINQLKSSKEIETILQRIRQILIEKHEGLFIEEVDLLLQKVKYFGIHFAFIDIRQESDVHSDLFQFLVQNNTNFSHYNKLSSVGRINFLLSADIKLSEREVKDAIHKDVVASMKAMKKIQDSNGEYSCRRYIISQCHNVLNIVEVYALLKFTTWGKNGVNVDIVPLFETVDDLSNAVLIIKNLLKLKEYKQHLKARNNTQTIMLGFSDGTKDGGYLMANYAIYKAKIQLTAIAKEAGIDIVFFDGRGGPPGRGGGKTHKFYASLGSKISSREIQLTIQGQTISANFGNIEAAKYNMEQLLSAGISNLLLPQSKNTLSRKEETIIENLADISLQKYLTLKNHPKFIDYLNDVSTLKLFGKTNIGSRPTKRGKEAKLTLSDLRAIPFVASWNMMKQNIAGYYGLGTALHQLKNSGKFEALKKLYHSSLFFKTLMDNSEMALAKSNFNLTSHLSKDKEYKEIWFDLKQEFELTKKYLLQLSHKTTLMQDYPADAISVSMREKVVIPLITIQQFAIDELRKNIYDEVVKQKLENLIVRASFGIINAGRNSA